MKSQAPLTNWLFDPNLLKLVNQCRRLIHAEFGVKLHLTEENLEQQLAHYAAETDSSELSRVWATLVEQVPHLQAAELSEDNGQARRNLRGQIIAEDPPVDRGETSEGEEPQRAKRIYRGQVIG